VRVEEITNTTHPTTGVPMYHPYKGTNFDYPVDSVYSPKLTGTLFKPYG
jgi:hypothetical protein